MSTVLSTLHVVSASATHAIGNYYHLSFFFFLILVLKETEVKDYIVHLGWHLLHQILTNYHLRAKSGPPLIYVNKVLLESITSIHTTMPVLSHWDQSLKYLLSGPFRECLQTPVLSWSRDCNVSGPEAEFMTLHTLGHLYNCHTCAWHFSSSRV